MDIVYGVQKWRTSAGVLISQKTSLQTPKLNCLTWSAFAPLFQSIRSARVLPSLDDIPDFTGHLRDSVLHLAARQLAMFYVSLAFSLLARICTRKADESGEKRSKPVKPGQLPAADSKATRTTRLCLVLEKTNHLGLQPELSATIGPVHYNVLS